MRIFYVTLNNTTEARAVSLRLLERGDAVCCNWFPIQCAYLAEGEIKEGPEIVLIVKTQAGQRAAVEAAVAGVIGYTNFIGEFEPTSVNQSFQAWLDAAVIQGAAT